MTTKLMSGDRVEVLIEGSDPLPGHISRIVDDRLDDFTIKVMFDDPLVYGGTGTGWFKPDQVRLLAS